MCVTVPVLVQHLYLYPCCTLYFVCDAAVAGSLWSLALGSVALAETPSLTVTVTESGGRCREPGGGGAEAEAGGNTGTGHGTTQSQSAVCRHSLTEKYSA